jgi:hypothetical protein
VLAPAGRWIATAIRDGFDQPRLNKRKPTYKLVKILSPDIKEEILP